MNKEEHLASLKEIKDLMNKSSKFMSLNGWAGILSGLYACIAAVAAYVYLDFTIKPRYFSTEDDLTIGAIGLITLLLALATGAISSRMRAKKNGFQIWDDTAKQGLLHLAVPLIVGFFFCAALYKYNLEGLIAPATLIFYGLALFSASHFTFKEVKHLAFIQLALGTISLFFIGYGLLFWTLGFGIAHILYGIIVKRTYK